MIQIGVIKEIRKSVFGKKVHSLSLLGKPKSRESQDIQCATQSGKDKTRKITLSTYNLDDYATTWHGEIYQNLITPQNINRGLH